MTVCVRECGVGMARAFFAVRTLGDNNWPRTLAARARGTTLATLCRVPPQRGTSNTHPLQPIILHLVDSHSGLALQRRRHPQPLRAQPLHARDQAVWQLHTGPLQHQHPLAPLRHL